MQTDGVNPATAREPIEGGKIRIKRYRARTSRQSDRVGHKFNQVRFELSMLCVYVIRAIEIHIDGTSLERARISIEISVIHRYYCPVDGRARDTHTLRFCINPSPPVSLNCVFLYLFFYILVAEIILFRSLSEYFILLL